MINILKYTSYLLFTISFGMIYAYVYDIEPLTEEKSYQLERQDYNRSDHFDHECFPSFNEWQAQNNARDQRASDYLSALVQQVGTDFAECWEWADYSRDASQPMSHEQWKSTYGD